MNIIVDGINLNATHFASFKTVDEAVAAMKADGILSTHDKTEDWAEAVYVRCMEAVMPPAPVEVVKKGKK